MKSIIFLLITMIISQGIRAQEGNTGAIAGQLVDKEMEGAPLPFANVVLEGTSIGATTDTEGYFNIQDLEPGSYTIQFSFMGYETVEIPAQVVAGKVTRIHTGLGTNSAALEEVIITTIARKDSQIALMLEQKQAITVKESIGAQELSRLGISDAAGATARIPGVTISEATGDIFIRGLGDRYLYTTLNGLPIPSDDVDRKNIDLDLFESGILEHISVNKTYAAVRAADQASGTVDIRSQRHSGKDRCKLSAQAGINSNVVRKFDRFRVSPAYRELTAGFYHQPMSLQKSLTDQRWDPVERDFPVNHDYGLSWGKNLGDRVRLRFDASRSLDYQYTSGLFREYRSNNLYDHFSEVEIFETTDNTTALADLNWDVAPGHNLEYVSLFINKVTDMVYESGRNGKGVVFEETAPAEGLNQFVRDQNLKQTRLWVNQILGGHRLSEKHELEWAVGYNTLSADEPSRIRNELNIDGAGFIQLGRTGGFQQRKSSQKIDDREISARINDHFRFAGSSPDAFLELGLDYRNKERHFFSRFIGIGEQELNTLHPPSLDAVGSIFTRENLENGLLEIYRLSPDRYNARLTSYAAFAAFNYSRGPWQINLGGRFQQDELHVAFQVNNYPSTLPDSQTRSYGKIYPALNLKFSPTDKSNLRLAVSRTITLPEFKEIAPFEYVSPTGQITRGNPELEASRNLSLDLKYEIFPESGELLSVGGFFKSISDPINRVQDRGAAGIFSYFNAGREARVYGLEFSGALNLIKDDTPTGADLTAGFNLSRMWHSQDLREEHHNGVFIRTFRYNGKEEIGLQGASDWIVNLSLNLQAGSWMGSLAMNYASDKIYALGSPEIQTQPEVYYNDEIVEKGFMVLDAVLSKEFGQRWEIRVKGQNLLNPMIRRVQMIRPSATGIASEQVVRSYSRGAVFSLGIHVNL